MDFPAKLKYTKDHEWIRLESDDIAYVALPTTHRESWAK